ncbi:NADH-quinone oxidoreductase subunit N [Longispora fulva]|uniref:NADH-quinone oxidoreductase subunit N n=2 Tax=Longispora fulva TaxID=619741 RepID=A0A8J7GYP8_9ACTN|nr:NADH-quinone oxidoreductase subunit N [Longispora fulva]GIG57598.1 NADH-quinone oxidoreductase subunit N [Longispora fulva]
MTFQLPHLDYLALAPMLVLFGAACASILVEAAVPRDWRFRVQVPLTLISLIVAGGFLVKLATKYADDDGVIQQGTLTAGKAVAIDGPALFLQGALVVLGIIAVLLISERRLETGGAFVAQAAVTAGSQADRRQAKTGGATEVYAMVLFALAGMLLFCAANDLLTMFVALEVFSLPLYLLCALARRRRLLSQEASLKYFLLGAFASAFFLYGVAMIYGFAGRIDFASIHQAVVTSERSKTLLVIGLAMLAIGLLFKIAAVPFHVWTPDVYQGAPTPVTAFMAACTKVAAFGGLIRVLYVAFERSSWDFRPVLGAVAALTMIIGAVLAVTQTDIKRLLAYSSIANAGYLLTGALAMNSDGLRYTMFYLVAYGFTVLAAFGIITLVRDADGEATHLSRWAGLGRRSPLVAAVFTFLMLAFAGIPLTSGFTAKFGVFAAAVGGNMTWLVIVGVVSSMILAFPYLRVVVLMWLSEAGEDTPTVSIPGMFTSIAVAFGVILTLVLGVVPQAALQLAINAGTFLR